jgi:hypothetical protein
MQTYRAEIIGRRCHLIVPVRDPQGRSHCDERPTIISETHNLGRHMYLARLEDGTTMYLFDYEIKFDD